MLAGLSDGRVGCRKEAQLLVNLRLAMIISEQGSVGLQ